MNTKVTGASKSSSGPIQLTVEDAKGGNQQKVFLFFSYLLVS